MINSFAQKAELHFWDIMLPLLTRSKLVRKIVRDVLTFYHNEHLVRQVAFTAMIACAGFACGILIFTVKSMIG